MSGLAPPTSSQRNPEESVKVIRRKYDELVMFVTEVRTEFDALQDHDKRVKATDLINRASYHLREVEKNVLSSHFEQTIFYSDTLEETLQNMAYAAAYSQEARHYIRGFMTPLDAAVEETAAAYRRAQWSHRKANEALSAVKEEAKIAAANLDRALNFYGPHCDYEVLIHHVKVTKWDVGVLTTELAAAAEAETTADAAYQAAKAARNVYKTEAIMKTWAAVRAEFVAKKAAEEAM